jgi:hypothetical protein
MARLKAQAMNKHPHRARFAPLLALATALAAPPALALEATWSGFATLGYARTDTPYTYQRFITEAGSFKRDSLIAGQLDLRLSPQWSATVQAKLAPAVDSDTRWSARAAWAFVAWRPDNDWLVRAGKARVPLYLYSESLDVGVTQDMARMPFEVYSVSPTNDFTGLFVTRSFNLGTRDISIDAYTGGSDATARFWTRDGAPPAVQPGSMFHTVRVKISGLVLTSRDESLTWRLGVHDANSSNTDGKPLSKTFPYVPLGNGMGYWKVNDALPGGDIPSTDRVRNMVMTVGAEWQIDGHWRLAGEVVRMRQRDTDHGAESRAAYLALFRRIGSFTPYVSVARQRSSDGILEWRQRLTNTGLPPHAGLDQIIAADRVAGEGLFAFDQRSVALGVSYALSPTARIKAEWMRTQVGAASAHFDTPAGQPDAQHMHANTLSVNASVAF